MTADSLKTNAKAAGPTANPQGSSTSTDNGLNLGALMLATVGLSIVILAVGLIVNRRRRHQKKMTNLATAAGARQANSSVFSMQSVSSDYSVGSIASSVMSVAERRGGGGGTQQGRGVRWGENQARRLS